MQGSISFAGWSPPTGTLGALTHAAHQRAAAIVSQLNSLKDAARDTAPAKPFGAALRSAQVRVIGEVKRSSPSKGAIAPGLDAVTQAKHYERGGAAAVSVLTEPDKFGGSLADLTAVSASVGIPALRKDFLVHPVQLWEARAHGASAALLIVRSLDQDLLAQMMDAARDVQLETLVEVRDEAELERALAVDARVIGVNNRNLETLIIDSSNAPRVIRSIPAERIAIAESGMRTVDDVEAACATGADAVLIGSVISAAADPEAEVRALGAVLRIAR